jgi:NTE family protein
VQVDLFPARGPVPVNLAGVMTRHKDITYSSRSRFSSAKIAEMESLRGAMRRLIGRLPENLRDDPDLRALKASLRSHPVDIVHLIYRQSAFERESKDYEFSRPSMHDRWATGIADMKKTHEHLERLEPTSIDSDVTVYDLAQGFDAAPGAQRREQTKIERAEKVLAEPAKRARKTAGTKRTPTTGKGKTR